MCVYIYGIHQYPVRYSIPDLITDIVPDYRIFGKKRNTELKLGFDMVQSIYPTMPTPTSYY